MGLMPWGDLGGINRFVFKTWGWVIGLGGVRGGCFVGECGGLMGGGFSTGSSKRLICIGRGVLASGILGCGEDFLDSRNLSGVVGADGGLSDFPK